jgi:hypothetical protein
MRIGSMEEQSADNVVCPMAVAKWSGVKLDELSVAVAKAFSRF